MAKNRKSKRRKFKKIVLKLSKKEYDLLQRSADFNKISVNKFIKQSIRAGIDDIKPLLSEKTQVSKNQLSLFDFTRENNQTSMLEEYQEFYKD